jgi:hypothetical protein
MLPEGTHGADATPACPMSQPHVACECMLYQVCNSVHTWYWCASLMKVPLRNTPASKCSSQVLASCLQHPPHTCCFDARSAWMHGLFSVSDAAGAGLIWHVLASSGLLGRPSGSRKGLLPLPPPPCSDNAAGINPTTLHKWAQTITCTCWPHLLPLRQVPTSCLLSQQHTTCSRRTAHTRQLALRQANRSGGRSPGQQCCSKSRQRCIQHAL